MLERLLEILKPGRDNAITGAELCGEMNITRRELSLLIEHARRKGYAICASTSNRNGGYFIAETAAEMYAFCETLQRHAVEMFKTRKACLHTADLLPGGYKDRQEPLVMGFGSETAQSKHKGGITEQTVMNALRLMAPNRATGEAAAALIVTRKRVKEERGTGTQAGRAGEK